ncbi:MAG: methyl-accepting chemotaxis protein [Terracidiphilus sp.]|jgi:methyl-accepting chemotaxis protein
MLQRVPEEGFNEGWSSFQAEVDQLRDAISAGDLKRRLSADSHPKEAAPVCRTINQILDTLIQTHERAMSSVDGMCNGHIPEPFTDGFPGDFVRTKDICNDFIDVINRRNVQIAKMTEAAARGNLHVRANVEEFSGVNRHIFEGFNMMFDASLAPVQEIERVLTALSQMDLTVRVEGRYEGDYERIPAALNTVCSKLAKEVQRINDHTAAMAAASEKLTAIAKGLAQGAVETSRLAVSAANSSMKVSSGLTAAAAGSDEMLNSIREISQNACKASTVVQSAVTLTGTTTQKMSHLGQSSEEISNVIKVITRIAQQTNLLALNATIEAARAGVAGKGFAVVATEVKELAKGTAKATDEVSERIAAIRRDTKESVDGIAAIASVTKEINDISHTIAAAVEEQTATTNEMGRHVSEAAQTATAIAKEMGGLAEAARSTSAGATQTDSAIADLNNILGQLRSFVAMFRV